jgi:chaperonin GroEL
MLEDIAVLTGGQAITEDLGIKLESLSSRTSARPRRSSSTRTHDDHRGRRQEEGHPGPHRADPAEIDNTTSDYDREKLQERLAKLAAASRRSSSARRPRPR